MDRAVGLQNPRLDLDFEDRRGYLSRQRRVRGVHRLSYATAVVPWRACDGGARRACVGAWVLACVRACVPARVHGWELNFHGPRLSCPRGVSENSGSRRNRIRIALQKFEAILSGQESIELREEQHLWSSTGNGRTGV